MYHSSSYKYSDRKSGNLVTSMYVQYSNFCDLSGIDSQPAFTRALRETCVTVTRVHTYIAQFGSRSKGMHSLLHMLFPTFFFFFFYYTRKKALLFDRRHQNPVLLGNVIYPYVSYMYVYDEIQERGFQTAFTTYHIFSSKRTENCEA